MADVSPQLLFIGIGVAVVAIGLYLVVSGKPKGIRVAGVDDVALGEKKEITVGEEKLLLVKTKAGGIHVVGSKCTHFKAGLAKGVLCGDRIVCPLHAAGFNVTTGDIEDGPCLDPLPKYSSFVVGKDVYIKAGGPINAGRKVVEAIQDDQRQFVIIGGGPAGLAAAQSLRDQGFFGKVVVLVKEAVLPYDRTKMSKNMAITAEEVALRPASFYSTYNIDMRLGVTVTSVDTERQTVATSAGELSYHMLLIATGGPARTFKPHEAFKIPGAALDNVFVMREAADALSVTAAITSSAGTGAGQKPNVVIVGSSFIGMEAAAYLIKLKTVNVTVVGMETEPFERVLGLKVGAFMRRMHEGNGVQFRLKAIVEAFEGSAGKVTGVRLKSGELLPADVCIIGAGIIPATEFLKGSAIPLFRDGSVEVNEFLQAYNNVFAAGDVARFPYAYAAEGTSPSARIEHWDVAYDQGRIAAQNMLKKRVPYRGVPFFWTAQYGKSLRSAGYASEFHFEVVQGNMDGDSPAFTVYYMQRTADPSNARVASVVTFNKDPAAVAAMELIRIGKIPDQKALEANPSLDLEALLATVSP